MKTLLSALALVCFTASSCFALDMSEYDKKFHMAGSAVSAGVINSFLGATDLSRKERIAWAAGITLGLGLAKELKDEHDYGGFSTDDLIADAIGTVAGICISEGFLYIIADQNGIKIMGRF